MFKRVYVELSDYCNLECKFCTNSKNTRMLNFEQFLHILGELKGLTKEIVLHVLGEPLIHPDLVRMIEYASNDFDIMITTNGFLLKKYKIIGFLKFKKMNISLHSSYFLNELETIKYLDEVFEFIEFAHLHNEEIIFNLRLWTSHNKIIEHYINKRFNISIDSSKVRLMKKVIVTYDEEFEWPNLNNLVNNNIGTCLGGKFHIAILANGEVAICCLDANGSSKLGNIFDTKLSNILQDTQFKVAIEGFNSNKLNLDICKHCTYHNRKK